jgi:small multidrug resistance pump
MTYWLYLLGAIVFELAGTTCMKLAAGFSRTTPSILMLVFYIACFSCLTVALKRIELSTAYAIWSGVGTAVTAAIGILVFQESFSGLKVIGILSIIVGVVALNLAGNHS